MVEFRGHPKNVSFMQFSQKIYGFRQNDSQGFENSYNSIYKQNPLERFFIFTIYQNYTLALTPILCSLNICLSFLQDANVEIEAIAVVGQVVDEASHL